MQLGQSIEKKVSKTENVIHICNRHPAGLIPIYLATIVGIILSFVVINSLSNNQDLSFLDMSDAVYGTLLIIIFILISGIAVAARQIYWANELILTDENIIHIVRPSLFSQDVVQHTLSKIQDVSVKQRGFWQFWMRYGTVVVETAGEESNFSFKFAPKPNDLAKEIMNLHDAYLEKHGLTVKL